MELISEEINLEREEEESQSVSKMFKKRRGTTNNGNEYEHLYTANLILKLILKDEIENFYISSNDEKFGTFDDVVAEIQYKNHSEFFALQLKHVNKKSTLTVEKLNATTGDFSIKKYYDDFIANLRTIEHPLTLILSTNCTLDSKKTKKLSFDEQKVRVVRHQENKLIGTSVEEECCYVLQSHEKISRGYEEFFHNFYLYTDQLDVQRLKEHTFEIFKENFSSDTSVFNDYVSFITQWSMIEGRKLKLDKKVMQRVVSLCVLSPFIKPLSFAENNSVDNKGKIFREAVSKFVLTILERGNYEKINCLWLDIVNDLEDMKETNNINSRYQVMRGRLQTKESLYKKDLISVNKLMWLLEKSPLVVEGCPQVYQVIKICQEKNLIVLDDRKNFDRNIKLDKGNPSVFQNLSDLKQHEPMYTELLENFSYSLEGQKEVELKHLIGISKKIEHLITSDDLAEMLEAPWLIGNPKEDLPTCHTQRKVTKIVIDFEFLKHIPRNTVAVVSCVRDFNHFKSIFPNDMVHEIADVEKIRKTKDKKIYTCENDFPQKQFIGLCAKNLGTRFHHFRYLVDGQLEWISSENYDSKCGDFAQIEKFRVQGESSKYILHESEFFNSTDRNINIICADPGMGKSTLMKSLKNTSSSLKWTVVIFARNHALYFRSHRSDNIEKFVEYVLNFTCKQCTNELHENVFRRMMDQNRIQIVWDGLDEASDATQGAILTLVKTFSKKGVKQWLTARNNLKYTLEVKLSTLSQNIKQFDDGEQREYIKNRLHISEDELSETFDKIKKNIIAFPNYEILGIPLQIYMLTELFSSNKTKYLNLLDDIFTVIDLYKYFVEEKFNILYQHKYNTDLSNEQHYQTFEDEKTIKINYYKRIAANSYIYNSYVRNLCNKIKKKIPWSDSCIEKFLDKVASTGDGAGFITRVTSQNDVEFLHNSYGEYFAALYLFENDVEKVRHKKFISDGRYNNIHFFLDLMLSKNCKWFVAVIYKNPALVEDSGDVDLMQNDSIGRDILEVACSRNTEYPVVKQREILEDGNFKRKWVCYNAYNTRRLRPLNYTRCQKFYKVNKNVDMCLKKLLLFLPFLIPFFGEREFSEEYLPAVLYYAIRFDFVMIFECIEHSVSLKHTYKSINSRSILALAMYSRSERILRKLLSQERYYRKWDCLDDLRISNSEIDEILTFALQLLVRTDTENGEGQMLPHYACKNDLIKTLRLLIERNVRLDVPDGNGKLPIHYAYEGGHCEIINLLVEVSGVQIPDNSGWLWTDLKISKLLLENGAKVNVPDKEGNLPMHYACKEGGLNTVKLLLENGSKVDVPDKEGKLPIHHACKGGGVNTVKLLYSNGTKVDVPDRGGRFPIHYACENIVHGHDIISFLIDKGAKFDVPDEESKLPLHDACKGGALNAVKSLLGNGAKVDAPGGNARLPIHYACENILYGHDIISFLLENGVKLDIPDGEGKLPMHHACKRGASNIVKLLLANGAKINIPDGNGRFPIHYACENIVYGHHIVASLIEKGAKLDIPDGEDKLPMHYACKRGLLNTVKLLLANGAKVDVPDKNGRLPIHCAYENIAYNHDIVSILIEKSAKMNVPHAEE